MRTSASVRSAFSAALAAVLPLALLAQDRQVAPSIGGPLAKAPVAGAPFSALATTTMTDQLPDGTERQRTGVVRYYRDGAGRVRVEQDISSGNTRITVLPDPQSPVAWWIDPALRTAKVGGRDIADTAVGGGNTFAVPLGGVRFHVFQRAAALAVWHGLGDKVTREPLGSRQLEGIEVEGTRVTVTLLPGMDGNDEPWPVTDEQWLSPELSLVLHARASHPRAGTVEYRVTNVKRGEPPADLFVVPDDYFQTRTDMSSPWIATGTWRSGANGPGR